MKVNSLAAVKFCCRMREDADQLERFFCGIEIYSIIVIFLLCIWSHRVPFGLYKSYYLLIIIDVLFILYLLFRCRYTRNI